MTVILRRTPPAAADIPANPSADLADLADVTFLRMRCSQLQGHLSRGGSVQQVEAEALDSEVMRRWTRLLVPDLPWSAEAQDALEDLYVLHARVVERIARGGVGDISPDVESLVRALLIDALQSATDRAVATIS